MAALCCMYTALRQPLTPSRLSAVPAIQHTVTKSGKLPFLAAFQELYLHIVRRCVCL
jgi:hypothetical protein